jgi:hypothetical protein
VRTVLILEATLQSHPVVGDVPANLGCKTSPARSNIPHEARSIGDTEVQAPAWPQYPMNLSQSLTRTGHVLQQVVGVSDIEAPVAERHPLNRALYESNLGIASQSLAKLYVDGCKPASHRAKHVDLVRSATPREQHVHVRQAQAAPCKLLNEESTSRVLSNAACHASHCNKLSRSRSTSIPVTASAPSAIATARSANTCPGACRGNPSRCRPAPLPPRPPGPSRWPVPATASTACDTTPRRPR